jgi:hypothetical protein
MFDLDLNTYLKGTGIEGYTVGECPKCGRFGRITVLDSGDQVYNHALRGREDLIPRLCLIPPSVAPTSPQRDLA